LSLPSPHDKPTVTYLSLPFSPLFFLEMAVRRSCSSPVDDVTLYHSISTRASLSHFFLFSMFPETMLSFLPFPFREVHAASPSSDLFLPPLIPSFLGPVLSSFPLVWGGATVQLFPFLPLQLRLRSPGRHFLPASL